MHETTTVTTKTQHATRRLSKAEREEIRIAFYRLQNWADGYRGRHSVRRWIDEAMDEATRHEREHRNLGRRMLSSVGMRLDRHGWSVQAIAQAFITRIVWEGPRGMSSKADPNRTTWADTMDLRSDFRIGYAIRQALKADPGGWKRVFPKPLPHFDYAKEMED